MAKSIEENISRGEESKANNNADIDSDNRREDVSAESGSTALVEKGN